MSGRLCSVSQCHRATREDGTVTIMARVFTGIIVLVLLSLLACNQRDRARSSESLRDDPSPPCPTLNEHRDAAAQRILNVIPAADVSGLYLLGPERVLASSMRADLTLLTVQQEQYYADHGTYGDNVVSVGMRPLPGVDIQVLAADTSGWSATATSCLARTWCTISIGTGPATRSFLLHQQPDTPACET